MLAGWRQRGWVPAPMALCLSCLFLGPDLGFHLHHPHICPTLIKASAFPVSSPVSSLLPWEKDLILERAQASAHGQSLGPGLDTSLLGLGKDSFTSFSSEKWAQ